MNDLVTARAAPTVASRLELLVEGLGGLRERFKDAVARLVGRSAADAASDLVRLLLGLSPANEIADPYDDRYRADREQDPWYDDDQGDMPYAPTARPTDAGGLPLPGFLGWVLALLPWLAPLASWAGVLLG